MENSKDKICRDKAVASHSDNAPLFADRYALMADNPYASAFIYGRKKFFGFLFPFLAEKLKPESRILDVGSGTGYLVDALEKRGFRAVGIEPADGMRAQTLKRYPMIEVHSGTVSELPFAGDTFDAVLAVEVFRYLPPNDTLNGFRECLRVLKPGRYFIATLVNRYALDGFSLLYLWRWILEKAGVKPLVNYCNPVTPAEIERLFMREFGLKAETRVVLFSPLRLAYKVNAAWGSALARRMEKFDEKLSTRRWWRPFGGHLILIVRKK